MDVYSTKPNCFSFFIGNKINEILVDKAQLFALFCQCRYFVYSMNTDKLPSLRDNDSFVGIFTGNRALSKGASSDVIRFMRAHCQRQGSSGLIAEKKFEEKSVVEGKLERVSFHAKNMKFLATFANALGKRFEFPDLIAVVKSGNSLIAYVRVILIAKNYPPNFKKVPKVKAKSEISGKKKYYTKSEWKLQQTKLVKKMVCYDVIQEEIDEAECDDFVLV